MAGIRDKARPSPQECPECGTKEYRLSNRGTQLVYVCKNEHTFGGFHIPETPHGADTEHLES